MSKTLTCNTYEMARNVMDIFVPCGLSTMIIPSTSLDSIVDDTDNQRYQYRRQQFDVEISRGWAHSDINQLLPGGVVLTDSIDMEDILNVFRSGETKLTLCHSCLRAKKCVEAPKNKHKCKSCKNGFYLCILCRQTTVSDMEKNMPTTEWSSGRELPVSCCPSFCSYSCYEATKVAPIIED